MSEKESIINFYAEYQKIKKGSTEQELIDVLGFLDSELQPTDKNHLYYKLVDLEDKYIETIKQLHSMFRENVPCIKNFLMVELGYKRNNPVATLEHD